MTIKQLYVAGAGLMGAGIAQTAISQSFDVTLREVDDNLVTAGSRTSSGGSTILFKKARSMPPSVMGR